MVYKGVDTMLDREVAIKVMRPELASQTSVVERFRSEAVTLAKLNHPNIATLYSLFRDAEDLFMVLEYVEGESLEDILQRRGALPAEEAIPIFCQALDGINYAHKLAIIHRDIKPSNMMLTSEGVLKVLDFGIARLLGTARMTRVGNIIGTLEYMSPEQVRGEETDARSDIYGLGMMLYEMLTGSLPFESTNEFVLMKAHTEEMPVPPRQLNPDIPEAIEAAIMRAVAKDPNDRFQNGGEFLKTIIGTDLPFASTGFGFGSMFQATVPSPTRETDRSPAELSPTTESAEPAKSTSDLLNETAEAVIPVPEDTVEDVAVTEILPSEISRPELKETRVREEETAVLPKSVIKETRLGEPKGEPIQKAEIKPTRLGTRGAPVTDSTRVKETRFEVNQPAVNPLVGASSAPAGGILDNLTWVHFSIAGAAVVVLFGLLGLAAVIPFLFSGGGTAEPPTAVNSNTKIVEAEPSVRPTEEATPFENDIVQETTPTPISDQPIDEPTPKPNPTGKKTPAVRKTPTKRKTPRKTPVKQKTPKSTKDRLKDELTKKKKKTKKPDIFDN
jgi:serine/threonine-protein kinase